MVSTTLTCEKRENPVFGYGLTLAACLFMCFYRAVSLDLPCPSNATNITLTYSYFQGAIENTRGDKKMPTTLNDLKGLNVNILRDFFAACPMHYTLMHVEYPSQLQEAEMQNLSFITLNQHLPANFSHFNPTIPVLILPTCIVYFGEVSTTVSPTIIIYYGIAYVTCSVIGAIVFLMIERWEIKERKRRNYADVLWKFLLSPFGLCDESLMKTLSMKIFTFTWLAVWLLMLGFFWAEMSSNMTVSKLNDNIDSLEDVLVSKRQFFWLSYIKDSAEKTLKDRYEKFANEEHRKFEKLESLSNELKSTSKNMLLENQILLTWCPDLILHIDGAFAKKPHLVIKKDWSSLISIHHLLSKDLVDTLDALNEFITRRRSSGKMEQELDRWFGLNQTGTAAASSRHAAGDPKPSTIILVIALVGTIVTIMTSFFSCLRHAKKRHKDQMAHSPHWRKKCARRNHSISKRR